MSEQGSALEDDAVRDASPAYSVDAETASAENVPPGYKQTELGVIPEDWSVIELGELARFTTGPFGTALHKSDYIHGGIPLINPMHIVDEQLSPDPETSISEEAARRLAPYCVRASDIVIGRRGDMGRCAVVSDDQVGWLCGTGSLIIRCSDRTNAIFVQRILTTERVITAIEDGSVGSTMTNLNQGALARLKIQLPSMYERHAIATALSDADALIESLDRLIAKKRAIKQAAMQQLLTGQTRLPGFTGEWETKRLGELGTFYKGQGIRRDEVSDEGVPCIRYGEIYTRYDDCVVAPESRIPESVAESAFPLRCGDVLFAGSGETAEEIGLCVAYLGEQPAFAGGDIVVLRPNEDVSAYLGRLLNHPTIAQQKARLGQGDAVVHISARNLAQIGISLPPTEEQTAIATVLSDMDAEIEALEHRRDKARQVKQGMMRQLLTGKVRLVTPTEESTSEPS